MLYDDPALGKQILEKTESFHLIRVEPRSKVEVGPTMIAETWLQRGCIAGQVES
jgi:hypothetical protein